MLRTFGGTGAGKKQPSLKGQRGFGYKREIVREPGVDAALGAGEPAGFLWLVAAAPHGRWWLHWVTAV